MALQFAVSLDIQDGSCQHDKRADGCGRLQVVVPCLSAYGGDEGPGAFFPGEWNAVIGPAMAVLAMAGVPAREPWRGGSNCGLCVAIDVSSRRAVR